MTAARRGSRCKKTERLRSTGRRGSRFAIRASVAAAFRPALTEVLCEHVSVWPCSSRSFRLPTLPVRFARRSRIRFRQTDLALTVYNADLALVRDVRNVNLPAGSFDLRFMDIAATVNPATVHFRSLTEPARLDVVEQNYEYDLLEPEKLLRKYVGRDVTLVRARTDNGTTREEEVKARLLGGE